jgi:hypothetical protein
LTDEAAIDRAAKDAFKALRARARTDFNNNTGPLETVYAMESFLRRLAVSPYAHNMVLKGGMLMAANQIRHMTRDADLSTHGLANEERRVRDVVREIAALNPDPHDGIVIDLDDVRTEVMREDADYHGVRCKLVARLAQAKVPFALDFSFGDPGRSTIIELDSVIDRPAVRLDAYPLTLNLAEKIVTAMQRRETSTRDRDFADLWVTSRVHSLPAAELREHIDQVAAHRAQDLITMAGAFASMPDRQSAYTAMVQRMSYLHPPPERFSGLIAGVIEFVDPLLASADGELTHWDHRALRWT